MQLGVVTHYFYRVEYQHRGTQHVHCLFWTKDRPQADASAAEVEAFLDKYVTCRMPDAKTEPELYAAVKNNQMHWPTHSKTSRRRRKIKGRWTTEVCRFGFPRLVCRRTIFFVGDRTVKKMGCELRDRAYHLARKKEETMINDYSPGMVLTWDGNVDVQFIPEGIKNILSYTTGYTRKGEKAKRAEDKSITRMAMEGMKQSDLVWKIAYYMLE
ncbi:unnamed protein product [Caenorhabditis sp. 36 PRJEB53466]|nr:unnamed protein product [Caenorhabditis sp. 36 PRJEB53466]